MPFDTNTWARSRNFAPWPSNPLGQRFLADLEADYLRKGADTIARLRKDRPLNYLWLTYALRRDVVVAEPPLLEARAHELPTAEPVAGQPNQPATEPTDPRNDPYRVVKRSIAREKLRDTIHKAEQELARLAAEEETETRAAEEEIDARLAARRAEREAADASARARAAASTTETAT